MLTSAKQRREEKKRKSWQRGNCRHFLLHHHHHHRRSLVVTAAAAQLCQLRLPFVFCLLSCRLGAFFCSFWLFWRGANLLSTSDSFLSAFRLRCPINGHDSSSSITSSLPSMIGQAQCVCVCVCFAQLWQCDCQLTLIISRLSLYFIDAISIVSGSNSSSHRVL